MRALKNCFSLESCANLAFNDHREDIRVLTCSAGQNGNKILDSFRISSWSQMLIHSPVTSGHLISPDTGGMAAPEEVVRTHTHSHRKTTAANQPKRLTFSLISYSCGVSKGWMGAAHLVICKVLQLCTTLRCSGWAEQLFCSGLFVPANIIKFLRLQHDGILYLIPEQSALGLCPSDSALTPAFRQLHLCSRPGSS